MIQTFDLPVLSLAIPNIDKLNEISVDNLSQMWTVFSKCKDSLENGRRLENMSWRLWYRESLLKQTAPTAYSIPIIQPLTAKKESDNKPLSSLKRIISSLNENEIIRQMPPPPTTTNDNNKVQAVVEKQKEEEEKEIQFEKPVTSASKFFINDDDDESDTDEGWSSDNNSSDEEEVIEFTPKTNTMSIQVNTNQVDSDETAFLSEFKKRSPIKSTKGHSILSNMLRAEGTRLANQTIRVVPNQKHVTDELSTSMRKCLEWEQNRFAHDIIMNSNVEATSPTTTHEVSIGYW